MGRKSLSSLLLLVAVMALSTVLIAQGLDHQEELPVNGEVAAATFVEVEKEVIIEIPEAVTATAETPKTEAPEDAAVTEASEESRQLGRRRYRYGYGGGRPYSYGYGGSPYSYGYGGSPYSYGYGGSPYASGQANGYGYGQPYAGGYGYGYGRRYGYGYGPRYGGKKFGKHRRYLREAELAKSDSLDTEDAENLDDLE